MNDITVTQCSYLGQKAQGIIIEVKNMCMANTVTHSCKERKVLLKH